MTTDKKKTNQLGVRHKHLGSREGSSRFISYKSQKKKTSQNNSRAAKGIARTEHSQPSNQQTSKIFETPFIKLCTPVDDLYKKIIQTKMSVTSQHGQVSGSGRYIPETSLVGTIRTEGCQKQPHKKNCFLTATKRLEQIKAVGTSPSLVGTIHGCFNKSNTLESKESAITNCAHYSKLLNFHNYVYRSKTIDTDFRKVITDQKRRGKFEQKELENLILKSVLTSERQNGQTPTSSNRGQKKTILGLSQLELSRAIHRKLKKPCGSISRVRNRCVISGRSSVIGSTGLSRIKFRRLAGFGKIPGLLKI